MKVTLDQLIEMYERHKQRPLYLAMMDALYAKGSPWQTAR